MRRSNQLVLAGVAFFVVGVVIVLLLARDNGSGGSSSSAGGAGRTVVLVAKEDIAANSKGSEVADKVEVRQVDIAEKQPNALTSASQLSNARFTAAFKKGEQILQSGLQTAIASITPPDGKQAIAVRFSNVPGGAEYVQAGDHVNIYQVLPTGVAQVSPNAVTPVAGPTVKLLLTNVEVLAVNKVASSLDQQGGTTATTLAPTQQRVSLGGELDFVFALDTIDAEKVIFGSQIDTNFLYLAKVGDKAPAAVATPGQTYESILQEPPDQAAAREATAN